MEAGHSRVESSRGVESYPELQASAFAFTEPRKLPSSKIPPETSRCLKAEPPKGAPSAQPGSLRPPPSPMPG